jgi:Zn-dependent peptidase ImmA (M78 family)
MTAWGLGRVKRRFHTARVFVRVNTTERLCNRFAGSFLAPEPYVKTLLRSSVVKDPDLDDVKSAARHLKISQEATVLRLEQLGLYRAGSYDKWKKLIIRTWSSVIPANTAHQPPSAPPIS